MFRYQRRSWVTRLSVQVFNVLIFFLFLSLDNAFSQVATQGTRIQNRMVATYFDTGSGYHITLESNFVSVIVNPLPGIQLIDDRIIYRLPGDESVFAHTIINKGNVASSYRLDVSNLVNDDFDLIDLKIFLDANSNGLADLGETEINSSYSIDLDINESADVVVTGAVPLSATVGDFADVEVKAELADGSISTTNMDKTIISGGALVELNKTVNNPLPLPGAEVIFTLTARNTGTASAGPHPVIVDGAQRNLLLIRDPLPANVTFVGFESVQNATPLFHVSSQPTDRYNSILSPSDFDLIDEVAFGLTELAANQTVSVSFRVRVNDNARGVIENIANLLYNDGIQMDSLIVTSNGVQIQLPEDPPDLEYFDENYQLPAAFASRNSGSPREATMAG
ncbi:MAG: hypothetical protein AAFP70_16915, partial [Calditrichota bacterium]